MIISRLLGKTFPKPIDDDLNVIDMPKVASAPGNEDQAIKAIVDFLKLSADKDKTMAVIKDSQHSLCSH